MRHINKCKPVAHLASMDWAALLVRLWFVFTVKHWAAKTATQHPAKPPSTAQLLIIWVYCD